MTTTLKLLLAILACHQTSYAQFLRAGQAQPWGMPQMRQRMNLQYGICSNPMVITVCLEGSMARNKNEFRHMLNFTGLVVSALDNIQPRQIATCSIFHFSLYFYAPADESQFQSAKLSSLLRVCMRQRD
ncbi:hypothetical protein ElyMa_001668500 [Elysia marginata]|uniref:VWFA domain-containing protein n=1 Tax=Elysia marginata TaxID=1093978 RepID=A0AAV4JPK8_9GAST|nr:hypothetical protein ElyMa_001668500 [Elysia marginata]